MHLETKKNSCDSFYCDAHFIVVVSNTIKLELNPQYLQGMPVLMLHTFYTKYTEPVMVHQT